VIKSQQSVLKVVCGNSVGVPTKRNTA